MAAGESAKGTSNSAAARQAIAIEALKERILQAKAKQSGEPQAIESLDLRDLTGLAGLDAAEITFKNCDFSGVSLTDAILANATFDGCLLQQTTLDDANLIGARFTNGSDLHAAKMRNAHANEAKFLGATMTEVDATGADFRNSDFSGSSLKDATFDLADLRGARNFLFDHTKTRGVQLLRGGSDPWSVLRRVYTGPRLFLNLLPVLVFVVTIAGKSYGLYVLALLQSLSTAQLGIASYCRQSGVTCETRTVLEVLVGVGEGPWAVGFVIFAIVYNALRFVLTMAVARLRDEEGRSDATPPYGMAWVDFRDRVCRAIKRNGVGQTSKLSELRSVCLDLLGTYRIPLHAHRALVVGQLFMYALFVNSLYGILAAEVTLPG